MTRLDQIACGNIAQCYLELGQFRKALDFNAKVCGPPCSRGSEAAERQDREAPNPDLHVKALSRSSRCLSMGDLDGEGPRPRPSAHLAVQARARLVRAPGAFRARGQTKTLKGAFAATATTADDRADLGPTGCPSTIICRTTTSVSLRCNITQGALLMGVTPTVITTTATTAPR